MEEFQSKLISIKRDSKYSYMKMMEYFDNKNDLQHCHRSQISRGLPTEMLNNVQKELAAKIAENQEILPLLVRMLDA